MEGQLRVISRALARASNLNRYFTGKPCKHGHLAERYVNNAVCVQCQHVERTSKRASKHNAEYRQANRERMALKDLKHHSFNRPRYRTKQDACTPPWADRDAILSFYQHAKELRAATGVYWTVDHIVPLKSPIVCGLHCEANLQILERAENTRKHNKWWPDMPDGCKTKPLGP
jgi:hypothetical protein